jgi:hypothetical protein
MREPTREHERLRAARGEGIAWRGWGPYLSERQWGTVREDYSTRASRRREASVARYAGRRQRGRHHVVHRLERAQTGEACPQVLVGEPADAGVGG